jgi:hypothetical protein
MFGLLQVSGAQAICWPGLMPFDAAEEMRSPLNSPQEKSDAALQKVVVRQVQKSTSSEPTCRWWVDQYLPEADLT